MVTVAVFDRYDGSHGVVVEIFFIAGGVFFLVFFTILLLLEPGGANRVTIDYNTLQITFPASHRLSRSKVNATNTQRVRRLKVEGFLEVKIVTLLDCSWTSILPRFELRGARENPGGE